MLWQAAQEVAKRDFPLATSPAPVGVADGEGIGVEAGEAAAVGVRMDAGAEVAEGLSGVTGGGGGGEGGGHVDGLKAVPGG